jgi:hydroxymethylglutaryl-CoA lyase
MVPAADFKWIECPRDAMQGWPHWIATADKVRYLNALLKVGFDTLDFGSFVSPKAIPQMADTAEVLSQLDLADTSAKLLAIIANTRGAETAVQYDAIHYLGFPFSISPTFQLRNTNSTQEESLIRIHEIQELCGRHKKELVIYLSMGFGNPYGDAYSQEILLQWADAMAAIDVRIISLADTVGLAGPDQIRTALQTLIPAYTNCVFGVHLHARSDDWMYKVQAAVSAGCTRIDGAVKGIGGCPMAQDDLVGNLDTLSVIPWLQQKGLLANINTQALLDAAVIADQIFIK